MKRLAPNLLGLSLLLCACQLEDPQVGLPTEAVLTLAAADSVLLADGRDLTTLTAQLGPEAQGNLPVTFNTSQGYFESSEGGTPQRITVLASGTEAEAVLVAGREVTERVRVSASVSGLQDGDDLTFQATRILRFERAYPQELGLTLTSPNLPATPGSRTDLLVDLRRNPGQVSGGTVVFFSARPLAADGPELELPASSIADLDQLRVEVTNPDTVAGTVRLRAWVLDVQQDTVARSEVDLRVE